MVELADLSFGWILVVIGALFLVIEASSPGFFIAVPGTVMIILGVLLLLGVDIFSGPVGLVIGVVAAVAVSMITIWLYRRINPGETTPTTISRDTLVGMEGQVIKKVIPGSLSGKVLIAGQEWSARSASGEIPPGVAVRVTSSKGVHVVVEEVK
ncbi:MAG: NfeD family protein [Methanolinea sp.]|jgi:membrane-bound ClpP family serine protease|nr:NfeD family protein [Methanolinea sp.]